VIGECIFLLSVLNLFCAFLKESKELKVLFGPSFVDIYFRAEIVKNFKDRITVDIALAVLLNFSEDAVNDFLIYFIKAWEFAVRLSLDETED
jgi:hypothetical protein